VREPLVDSGEDGREEDASDAVGDDRAGPAVATGVAGGEPGDGERRGGSANGANAGCAVAISRTTALEKISKPAGCVWRSTARPPR
jgi:hypothetical protein